MVCTHNVRSFAVTLDLARQIAKDWARDWARGWARLAERKKAKQQKKTADVAISGFFHS
jgi:hypothetical protein